LDRDAFGGLRGGLCFGIGKRAFSLLCSKNSLANVSIAGIPVLPVVAVLSIIVMIGLAYVVLSYPQLGIIPWQGFAFMGALVVVGLLIYFIARAVRASQGINLDLIYRELPPE